MMNLRYAGIGSRKTPPGALATMTALAQRLATGGWTLESGGAAGADTAFAIGAGPSGSRIHVPEEGWRSHTGAHVRALRDDELARHAPRLRAVHPAWGRLAPFVRRLHGRNASIILGPDGTEPVRFVVCWTPGGKEVGGTATGIRLALAANLPVFNLAGCRATDVERHADGIAAAARIARTAA